MLIMKCYAVSQIYCFAYILFIATSALYYVYIYILIYINIYIEVIEVIYANCLLECISKLLQEQRDRLFEPYFISTVLSSTVNLPIEVGLVLHISSYRITCIYRVHVRAKEVKGPSYIELKMGIEVLANGGEGTHNSANYVASPFLLFYEHAPYSF